VSPTQLAGILYSTLRSDTSAVATLRAELSTLALKIGTDPGFGTQITSGTVNGQSFAGETVMSNLERLSMLRTFIAAVDAGAPPATRTYASF
jgi:hypothetical protein